ncbi:unnamed protein product [Cyprideis torosa]|uniref:Uncharacterized protein n=1 Tax=Cyprideis torosa TaxID=163714 RepID=A0A7R8ZJY9_9CRUS|nr:unnamed protein product [Cyprideis torosa]CAG0880632.1 unnamed protein product [Cyprideis torosa]
MQHSLATELLLLFSLLSRGSAIEVLAVTINGAAVARSPWVWPDHGRHLIPTLEDHHGCDVLLPISAVFAVFCGRPAARPCCGSLLDRAGTLKQNPKVKWGSASSACGSEDDTLPHGSSSLLWAWCLVEDGPDSGSKPHGPSS